MMAVQIKKLGVVQVEGEKTTKSALNYNQSPKKSQITPQIDYKYSIFHEKTEK